MELEEAIDRLIMMKHFICYDSDEDEENQEAIRDIEAIETVLQALENSIPKEAIEEKIKELNKEIEKYREYTELGIETDVEWVDNVANRQVVTVLQELLEEK